MDKLAIKEEIDLSSVIDLGLSHVHMIYGPTSNLLNIGGNPHHGFFILTSTKFSSSC